MAVESLCQTKLTLYSHELTLCKLSSLCGHERRDFVRGFTGTSGWPNVPEEFGLSLCSESTGGAWSGIVLSRRETWDLSPGEI